LRLQTYKSLSALQTLRDDWNSLLAEYPHSTTFSTWEWVSSWWPAFGDNDRILALAGYEDERLVGFAPFAIHSERALGTELRLLRLIGDGTPDADNLDIPVRPDHAAPFSNAVLDWLGGTAEQWDICQLRTLPPDSLVGNCINELARARAWNSQISTRPGAVIELPETWAEYVKMLSAKERGKIGLRLRRLEKKYKVDIQRCTQLSDLDDWLMLLFDLHGKHWEQRDLSGTLCVPERRAFFRALASSLLTNDTLEFWRLKLNGTTVAAQFGFRYSNAVFSLQEGFDPAYSSDSPGYVLRSQVLKALIERGIRRYDFLAGTNDSKMRWGAKESTYIDIEFARPATKGSAYLHLNRAVRESRQWLKAHLPSPLLQGFRQVAHHLDR
jgi:CelD/BcsL family acetyltransferase involved in cellulose biosynthesis